LIKGGMVLYSKAVGISISIADVVG